MNEVTDTVHGGADVQDSAPATDSATLTALIAMFRQREQVGLAKYGTTVDRADLTAAQWRQHHREELMDALLYSLAEEREQVGWQPIATAPEFGEEFMAWVIVDPEQPGFWEPRVFQDCNGCFQFFDLDARDHWVEQPHWKPTHWMPTPTAPEVPHD